MPPTCFFCYLLMLVPGMHLSYLLLGAFGYYVAAGFGRVAGWVKGRKGCELAKWLCARTCNSPMARSPVPWGTFHACTVDCG